MRAHGVEIKLFKAGSLGKSSVEKYGGMSAGSRVPSFRRGGRTEGAILR